MRRNYLSDTRGSRPGFLFFKVFLRIFGVSHARIMIRIVSLFYVLFDKKARQKALPYLRHRFPEDHGSAMLKHVWSLFAGQGEALLAQEAVRCGMLKTDVCDSSAEAGKIRMQPAGPIVLLCSHFGPWQAVMNATTLPGRDLHILMSADKNPQTEKLRVLRQDPCMGKIHIIDAESAWGGLMDAQEALEQGDVVAVMGDRNFETNPGTSRFFDENARLPLAGFHLAAKAHCPLVCLFAHPGKDDKTILLDFAEVLYPEIKGRDRMALLPYLQKYASLLESFCRKYPYECFLFEDIWEKK